MKELHDAFRGRESGIFLPNADTKGTDVPQYSFRGQLGELSGAERADGQLPGRDASIPGHRKGKGPGGYKLFGRESSLSKAK